MCRSRGAKEAAAARSTGVCELAQVAAACCSKEAARRWLRCLGLCAEQRARCWLLRCAKEPAATLGLRRRLGLVLRSIASAIQATSVRSRPQYDSRKAGAYVQQTSSAAAAACVDAQRVGPPETCHWDARCRVRSRCTGAQRSDRMRSRLVRGWSECVCFVQRECFPRRMHENKLNAHGRAASRRTDPKRVLPWPARLIIPFTAAIRAQALRPQSAIPTTCAER